MKEIVKIVEAIMIVIFCAFISKEIDHCRKLIVADIVERYWPWDDEKKGGVE